MRAQRVTYIETELGDPGGELTLREIERFCEKLRELGLSGDAQVMAQSPMGPRAMSLHLVVRVQEDV